MHRCDRGKRQPEHTPGIIDSIASSINFGCRGHPRRQVCMPGWDTAQIGYVYTTGVECVKLVDGSVMHLIKIEFAIDTHWRYMPDKAKRERLVDTQDFRVTIIATCGRIRVGLDRSIKEHGVVT